MLQVYDMSGSLKESPPPCHPATFSFDKWKPTDVILRVGDMVFRAHKDHLSYSCRLVWELGDRISVEQAVFWSVLLINFYSFTTSLIGHLSLAVNVPSCCRYFEAMFGNNMRESRTKEITMLDVDETSFRAILTSFYTGFLSVCSQCVLRLLRTGMVIGDVIAFSFLKIVEFHHQLTLFSKTLNFAVVAWQIFCNFSSQT